MNNQPLIPLNEPNNPTFNPNPLYSPNPVPLTKNYSTIDNTQKLFQYEDNNSQNSLRLKELLSKTNTLLSKIGIEEQINNPFHSSSNIHSAQNSSNIPIRNISILNTLSTDNINPLIKTIDSKETLITRTEEHKSNQPSLTSFNFKEQNYIPNKDEYNNYINNNNNNPPLDITNFNNSDIDKLTQYPLEDQVKMLFKANLYLNKQVQQLHKENSELRNEISSYRFTTQSCTNSQSIIKDNDKVNYNIIEENQKLKHLNKQYEQEIHHLKLQMNAHHLHHSNNKPITTTKKHNKHTISEHNVITNVNPIPIQKSKKPKSRMKHHEIIISELPKEQQQQQQHSHHNDVMYNNKTVTISSTLRDDDESKDIKRKLISNSNNIVNLKEQNEFHKKLSRKIILENDNQHHQICGSYYNIENTSRSNTHNDIQTHSKPKTNKHTKKSHKKKHKSSKSNVNNNIIYSIPPTHSKCYYDYYGNNTDRTKVCYACLFGLNQNSKGYSPLMCSSRNISPSKTLSSKRSKKHY
jgi:hypothetical protein